MENLKKTSDQKELTKEEKKALKLEAEKLKLEVAEELGLLDKVNEKGWKGLTARETGQLGGIIAKRNKQKQKNK